MPIYEFECISCSERFDRLQRLSDPDPDTCPNCGATGIRRRLTAPSFRLSGSGWYETDFKKDGDKKRNLTDKAEGAKSESKASEGKASESGSKSEVKAESKAETKTDLPKAAPEKKNGPTNSK